MRMANPLASVVAIAALTLLGTACSDSATDPALDTIANLSASAGPVVLSATGSGHRSTPMAGQITPLEEDGWRTFSFTAQQLQDGTTTGQMQLKIRAVPSALGQGRVFCMNDIGEGIIIVAAEATHRIADQDPGQFPGLPPAVVGVDHGIVFAVRDNGEGANAAGPDQITATLNTRVAVAGAICANPAAFGFSPAVVETFFSDVVSGNIQVQH